MTKKLLRYLIVHLCISVSFKLKRENQAKGCYGTIKMKLCNNKNDTLAGEKITLLFENIGKLPLKKEVYQNGASDLQKTSFKVCSGCS